MVVNVAQVNRWVLNAILGGEKVYCFERGNETWYVNDCRAMVVPKTAAFVYAPSCGAGLEKAVCGMLTETLKQPLEDSELTTYVKKPNRDTRMEVHIFTAEDGTDVGISEKFLKALPKEYVLYGTSTKPDQNQVVVCDQYEDPIAVFMPITLK